jgi:diguanylate cyclase (GGDEF)-like protein
MLQAIGDQPRWVLGIEAAAMLGAVAIADWATGTDLSFSILYLVPIVFLGWFVHRAAALTFALLGAVLWVVSDTLAGARYVNVLVPAWNSSVRLIFFAVTVLLVEQVRNAHERESALARTDSLTGIPNGRRFDERAELALATLRRTGRPVTLAYIDLDHFKTVNDTSGHTEGDRVLRLVAHAIDGRLRDTDMVARMGGDEFIVLLDDTGSDAAAAVLGDIREAIAVQLGVGHPVTETIGAVTFAQAPESVDRMVRLADDLMYRGKHDGRDRIVSTIWPGGSDEGRV